MFSDFKFKWKHNWRLLLFWIQMNGSDIPIFKVKHHICYNQTPFFVLTWIFLGLQILRFRWFWIQMCRSVFVQTFQSYFVVFVHWSLDFAVIFNFLIFATNFSESVSVTKPSRLFLNWVTSFSSMRMLVTVHFKRRTFTITGRLVTMETKLFLMLKPSFPYMNYLTFENNEWSGLW